MTLPAKSWSWRRPARVTNPPFWAAAAAAAEVSCDPFGTAGSISWKTRRVEVEQGVGQTSEVEASLPLPDVPRTDSYCSAPVLENSCRVEEIPCWVMGYYVRVCSIQ